MSKKTSIYPLYTGGKYFPDKGATVTWIFRNIRLGERSSPASFQTERRIYALGRKIPTLFKKMSYACLRE